MLYRRLLCLIILLPTLLLAQTSQPAKLKVLFITGGEAHDFKKLAPIVTGGIAKFVDVEITTRFGRECLKEKNLGEGFDAIVYDICYNGQVPEEYENLL